MSDTLVLSRQDLIMESVTDFFTDKKHLQQMMPILNQQAHISLRILDYFVTNYAKKKKIIYQHNNRFFNVFMNYKSQLKAYSKKQFDPFCRKLRKVQGQQINEAIVFYYDEEKYIETTVGQLNFFKWAIQNGVLAYIVDHLTDIVEDMILSTKQKKPEELDEDIKKENIEEPSEPSETKFIKKKLKKLISSPKKGIEKSVTAKKSITSKQKVKVVVSFN